MPGPWEKYAAATGAGPWEKYGQVQDPNAIGAPIREPNIQDRQNAYSLETDPEQPAWLRASATALNTALPIQAIRDMAGQASGERPHDVGSMIGDVAQVGSALPMGFSGPAGVAARAAGATGGATAGALEAFGVKNPIVRGGLPFLAGLAAGHFNAPNSALSAVPKGEEINALGRQAAGMGIPIGEIPAQSMTRTGPAPAAIREAWQGAIDPLGAEVGRTKALAMQTDKSTPEVLRTIQNAGQQGLEGAGVPRIGKNLRPEFSREQGAAGLVLDHLERIGMIPKNLPPEKAMELANNILESAQKITSESSSYGPNLAGRTAGGGLSGIQDAINSLGNPEAVASHQTANATFSKGKELQDLVEAATKGKGAGPVPMFRPKDFIANWQGLSPEIKAAKFSPEEAAAIDKLTQQNPNVLMRGLQFLNDKARDIGVKKLTFHPSTRFYEEAPTLMPRAGTIAVGAGAGTRAANYDPNQDEDLRKLMGPKPGNSLRQALNQ